VFGAPGRRGSSRAVDHRSYALAGPSLIDRRRPQGARGAAEDRVARQIELIPNASNPEAVQCRRR
jgi:hypothetical protein